MYRLSGRGCNFLIVYFKDYLFIWKVIRNTVTFKESIDEMFFSHHITKFIPERCGLVAQKSCVSIDVT